MPPNFSNCQPISREVQLQYPQLRIQGPWTALRFGSGYMELTARGAAHIGQLKQLLEHLSDCQGHVKPNIITDREHTHLPPSLFTRLGGISKRQLGQYQYTISSIIHLGHLICWQSSQYKRCSRVYKENFARGDLGSNVRSCSSSF